MSLPQVVLMRFAVPPVLLCVSFSTSAAQTPALRIGDRVRLNASLYQGTAVISDQSADELTLRIKGRAAPLVVPWNSIAALAFPVSRSRGQSARNGTKWGLGIGLVTGLLSILAPGGVDEDQTPASLFAANVVVVGVGIGALIGALRPGHAWQDVGVRSAREAARLASPPISAAAVSRTRQAPTSRQFPPARGRRQAPK